MVQGGARNFPQVFYVARGPRRERRFDRRNAGVGVIGAHLPGRSVDIGRKATTNDYQ